MKNKKNKEEEIPVKELITCEAEHCLNIVPGFKPDETVVFTALGFQKLKRK